MKKEQKQYEVEKKSNNVVIVRFPVVKSGWEQWFLMRSDAHHDSEHCNRELEKRHLDMARQRNALIMDFGDLFDAMQGRYDPRRAYPEMRKEYKDALREGKGYYNIIVDDAVGFYKQYAKLWLIKTVGNHENSVLKNADVNLTDLFIKDMQKENPGLVKGAYGGWVKFQFTLHGTQRESINLKYYHGSGGGGPVTKGTIQSNRQAVFLPDAHIVVNGHIHESWTLAMPRERISDQGVITQDIQWHVRTPTYKCDYGDGSGGWHVERGAPPKPMGCTWMRMYFDRGHVQLEFIQDIE